MPGTGGGLRPREERRESREESFWGESVARLGLDLEYGAVRRFPMRSAAAWGGDCGFPHGRALPRGVVQPGRAAWGAVSLASRPRVARLHQPADAGPFAWTRGGATASWDKFENLSGQKDRRRTGWETDATDSPTWRLSPRTGAALSPSPQPPPAVTRVQFTGHWFAGGGARARRGRGLATDLIHRPTRGRWGLAAGGRERRRERVERRWVRTWSTAPSAVFPCGPRRRGGGLRVPAREGVASGGC
jgi:hypothetical protein